MKIEKTEEPVLLDVQPPMKAQVGFLVMAGLFWLTGLPMLLTQQWGPAFTQFCIGGIFWGCGWLKCFSRRYVVTATRVITHKGLLSRRQVEIRIDHIRSVEVRQGALQRLLKTGDVLLGTAGTAGYEAVLKDVEVPAQVCAVIRDRNLSMSLRHRPSAFRQHSRPPSGGRPSVG